MKLHSDHNNILLAQHQLLTSGGLWMENFLTKDILGMFHGVFCPFNVSQLQ